MVPFRLQRSVLPIATLALLACGADAGDEPGADLPGVPATEQQPAAVTDYTADMIALEGSTTSGSLYIDAAGERPVVMVSLRGAQEGVHQGHVHTGTCAERGRSVLPLEPVETNAAGNGDSVTDVDMPVETLLNGQHIVVYHEAGGTPGASIVCADIPARQ